MNWLVPQGVCETLLESCPSAVLCLPYTAPPNTKRQRLAGPGNGSWEMYRQFNGGAPPAGSYSLLPSDKLDINREPWVEKDRYACMSIMRRAAKGLVEDQSNTYLHPTYGFLIIKYKI